VLFHPLVPAPVLWGTVNFGANYLAQKTINANRRRLGMEPIKNFTLHSAAKAKNFLIHSEYLGETDDGWQYEWEIGGYCFNDRYPCDEGALQRFRAFAAKDSKPLIFFTLGSCQAPNREKVCAWLYDFAKSRNCKLAVGSGWGKTGMDLAGPDYLVLDTFIPHSLVFPLCDYLVHHGGSGTTHSASRSGKPQLIIPLLLDQPYWSHRVRKLRLGPLCKKMGRLSRKYFEKKMDDLIGNSAYKKNAALLASQMEREKGLERLCDYVEKTVKEYKAAC